MGKKIKISTQNFLKSTLKTLIVNFYSKLKRFNSNQTKKNALFLNKN